MNSQQDTADLRDRAAQLIGARPDFDLVQLADALCISYTEARVLVRDLLHTGRLADPPPLYRDLSEAQLKSQLILQVREHPGLDAYDLALRVQVDPILVHEILEELCHEGSLEAVATDASAPVET